MYKVPAQELLMNIGEKLTNLPWIVTILLMLATVNDINYIVYRNTSLCNICGYYYLQHKTIYKTYDWKLMIDNEWHLMRRKFHEPLHNEHL